MNIPIRFSSVIELPRLVRRLAHEFMRHDHDLYLVGGSVRDHLLGQAPKDFDLATDAEPDRVIELIQKTPFVHKNVGKAFGVVIVSDDTDEVEIATFRKDIGQGRRPESVMFSTIDIDVKRRDFTINALFYDLQRFEIVDYVGGIEDIKNRVVRTVGLPQQRFEEDRLRILRAVRFASRFGTEIEEGTYNAIARDPSLTGVSEERIFDEFERSISTAHSTVLGINMMRRLGLLNEIFPGLSLSDLYVESKNIAVVTALLLSSEDPIRAPRRLLQLKWPGNVVRSIRFLQNLSTLNPHNVFQMWNARKLVVLSNEDIMLFARINPQCRVNACIPVFINKYKPTTSGADLIAEGFEGKAIGNELIKREAAAFFNLLQQSA